MLESDKMMLDIHRKHAAELGLSLQEYLLFRILERLEGMYIPSGE